MNSPERYTFKSVTALSKFMCSVVDLCENIPAGPIRLTVRKRGRYVVDVVDVDVCKLQNPSVQAGSGSREI
jgi:hypothetical protein